MASLAQTLSTPKLPVLKNSIYTMIAAFAGVVFGVLGSLGFVSSYLHTQFSAENSSLSHQIVSMLPSADVTSMCNVPSTGTGSGTAPAAVTAAKTASPATWTAPASGNQGSGGMGSGSNGGSHTPFVSQLVSGDISDTGPSSHNSITGTNTYTSTVTNNNNFNVSNDNSQSSSTGSAKVDGNTTGGSANSGDASNTNSTSEDFNVTN